MTCDIKDIFLYSGSYYDKVVSVNGWIKTIRKGKKVSFIKLSDGSSVSQLQIILNDPIKFSELINTGKTGMSISVNGTLVKSLGKEQNIELIAKDIIIIGGIEDSGTYPIAKTDLSLDFLRTIPHLKIRTDTVSSIMRIKSALKYGMSEFFNNNDFFEVQIPLITDNECESGACPFSVITLEENPNEFFKKKTFLTVSGQLHLETLVCGGLSKAWCMTTAFRAEKSTGIKHLAEFWMAELEFCFGNLDDLIKVNEDVTKYSLNYVLSKCRADMEFLESKTKSCIIEKIQKYIDEPFIITTHRECVETMLDDIEKKKLKFEKIPSYDDDFTKEHEAYITEKIYNDRPVFVKYYPSKVKAFYMPIIKCDDGIDRADCFDLLLPEIGEVIGGSQREHDYGKLMAKIEEICIKPETMSFYTDLRKYGTIPHGGSGIGFDRLMMVCTGIYNIRDMIPFPRAFEHCIN